jgi:uncharacterized protein
MSKLRISDDLLIPKDVVTSTLIVYGGKGMGKTNLGAVLVEELSKQNLRWCALDPLGVWWGLRYSQDGKSAGVECVILGGSHADFPIEPTGGAVVADMVVDETANFIIDFSRKPSGEMWSIGEKIRFITDYAYRLFQRQGELVGGVRREPIFQLLDEAARYIPQIIPAGNPQLAMCVAAWEQLVEEGRNIGIGVGLLTQRSARMNKSVSEVADAILSFRIVGPNSISAIMDWLGEHVPKERIKAMIEQVRSLERGSCLVVSPGWLQFEGVIKIRERQTFDSSATPKPGERARRVSGEGAKPDLAKYEERMKATIERVKESDPKALKAEVARLKQELLKKHASVASAASVKPVIDERAIERAVKAATEPLIKQLATIKQRVNRVVGKAVGEMIGLGNTLQAGLKDIADLEIPSLPAATTPMPAPARTQTPTLRPAPASSNGHSDSSLPKGEQIILRAIAQYEQGAQRDQLTVLTGYKRSTRDAYIQRLREKAFVVEDGRGGVIATQEGIAALGSAFEPLPTGEALQEYWLNRLPEGERKIFAALLGLSRESLEEMTGYKRSTRDAYIQRLQSRRLVEIVGRGEIRPSENLFA